MWKNLVKYLTHTKELITMIKRNVKRKKQSVPKQQVLATYPIPCSAHSGQQTLIPATAAGLENSLPIAPSLSVWQKIFSRKDVVEQRMAVAFQQLHYEFDQREQQLQNQFKTIQQQQTLLLEQKQRRKRSLIFGALALALAGGYMLFVLTNMQYSISGMTTYMQNMSGDTQAMSQNIQTMNTSIQQLNGNVGQMSSAIQPMGEIAQASSPMVETLRRFMPF
jgi:hypothetical protein